MNMNLIINRVKFLLKNEDSQMFFSKDDNELLFASSFEKLSSLLKKRTY